MMLFSFCIASCGKLNGRCDLPEESFADSCIIQLGKTVTIRVTPIYFDLSKTSSAPLLLVGLCGSTYIWCQPASQCFILLLVDSHPLAPLALQELVTLKSAFQPQRFKFFGCSSPHCTSSSYYIGTQSLGIALRLPAQQLNTSSFPSSPGLPFLIQNLTCHGEKLG